MIRVFSSVIVLSLFSTLFNVESKKVECKELGIYFMLPSGFRSLDSTELEKLGKRGEKAVREEYDKESMKGWQPECINVQDSFKRVIMMTSITVKEAIESDGSVDKFIEIVLSESNDFLAKRLRSRLGWEVNKSEAVSQSFITIGGRKVKKNSFVYRSGGAILWFAQYYFFNDGKKLYLLNFTGSPKASDNEEVMKAIEAAKPIGK